MNNWLELYAHLWQTDTDRVRHRIYNTKIFTYLITALWSDLDLAYIDVNKVGNKSVIFHIVAKRIGRWNTRCLLRLCYSVVCIMHAILVQIIDPIVAPPGEYVWNKLPLLTPWHRIRRRADVDSWKTVHPSAKVTPRKGTSVGCPPGLGDSLGIAERFPWPVAWAQTGSLFVP